MVRSDYTDNESKGRKKKSKKYTQKETSDSMNEFQFKGVYQLRVDDMGTVKPAMHLKKKKKSRKSDERNAGFLQEIASIESNSTSTYNGISKEFLTQKKKKNKKKPEAEEALLDNDHMAKLPMEQILLNQNIFGFSSFAKDQQNKTNNYETFDHGNLTKKKKHQINGEPTIYDYASKKIKRKHIDSTTLYEPSAEEIQNRYKKKKKKSHNSETPRSEEIRVENITCELTDSLTLPRATDEESQCTYRKKKKKHHNIEAAILIQSGSENIKHLYTTSKPNDEKFQSTCRKKKKRRDYSETTILEGNRIENVKTGDEEFPNTSRKKKKKCHNSETTILEENCIENIKHKPIESITFSKLCDEQVQSTGRKNKKKRNNFNSPVLEENGIENIKLERTDYIKKKKKRHNKGAPVLIESDIENVGYEGSDLLRSTEMHTSGANNVEFQTPKDKKKKRHNSETSIFKESGMENMKTKQNVEESGTYIKKCKKNVGVKESAEMLPNKINHDSSNHLVTSEVSSEQFFINIRNINSENSIKNESGTNKNNQEQHSPSTSNASNQEFQMPKLKNKRKNSESSISEERGKVIKRHKTKIEFRDAEQHHKKENLVSKQNLEEIGAQNATENSNNGIAHNSINHDSPNPPVKSEVSSEQIFICTKNNNKYDCENTIMDETGITKIKQEQHSPSTSNMSYHEFQMPKLEKQPKNSESLISKESGNENKKHKRKVQFGDTEQCHKKGNLTIKPNLGEIGAQIATHDSTNSNAHNSILTTRTDNKEGNSVPVNPNHFNSDSGASKDNAADGNITKSTKIMAAKPSPSLSSVKDSAIIPNTSNECENGNKGDALLEIIINKMMSTKAEDDSNDVLPAITLTKVKRKSKKELKQDYNPDEDLTHEQQEMLKNLNVIIPFELAPIHELVTYLFGTPRGQQLQQIQEMNIEYYQGAFSKKEDTKIKSNWMLFCKTHYLPDDPTPFVNLVLRSHAGRPRLICLHEARKFIQFLSKDLNNRFLSSVYKRFQMLYSRIRKGTYSQEEDDTILNFMKIQGNQKFPYSKLGRLLNRERLSIEKRHELLKQREKVARLLQNQEVLPTPKNIVKELMKFTNCHKVIELRDKKITNDQWDEVGRRVGVLSSRLRKRWIGRIYTHMFSEIRDITELKQKFVDLLIKYGVDDFRKINYTEYARKYFVGVTGLYLFSLLRETRKGAPPECADNLPLLLDYLKKYYFSSEWKPALMESIPMSDEEPDDINIESETEECKSHIKLKKTKNKSYK